MFKQTNFKYEDKGKIVKTYIFNKTLSEKDEQGIINQVLKNFPRLEEINYGGFKEKDSLKQTLEWMMFDNIKKNELSEKKLDIEKICELIKKLTELCEEFINQDITVFVIPTFKKRNMKELGGCTGMSPFHGTLLLFVNPDLDYEIGFQQTFCHELAHAVSEHYNMWENTIFQAMILDGVAEVFQERILKKKSIFEDILSEEDIKKYTTEILHFKDSTDLDKYGEVFFGKGKYPLWTGYSIGLRIVKDHLKKSKISIKNLLHKKPEEIFSTTEAQSNPSV